MVFGYTCANDVTARDVQQREKQWARAKGFDTSCPLGPWVETELDPGDLTIQCTVNGEQRQLGRTSDMIRSIEDLVVHITEAMTLLPGDVILTGTPPGSAPHRRRRGRRHHRRHRHSHQQGDQAWLTPPTAPSAYGSAPSPTATPTWA